MNCYRSEKPKQLLEKAEVYSNKHPFVTVPAILHNKVLTSEETRSFV